MGYTYCSGKLDYSRPNEEITETELTEFELKAALQTHLCNEPCSHCRDPCNENTFFPVRITSQGKP